MKNMKLVLSKRQAKTREDRKLTQKNNLQEYETYKESLKGTIDMIEGNDLKENMINERRDWINKYKAINKGEPPHLIDLFYKRHELEKKEELDENQKKVQENIAKEKLKKGQDSKKKEESGAFIKCKFII